MASHSMSVKDGEALSPTWVDAQVQRELIKVGGTDNERCRCKLMEVLMMGNLLPTQWILYEELIRSKALWH
jgi:hypothetical protein